MQRKKAMLPKNHGKPWLEEDEECLKQMFIRKFDPYNEKVFYIKASKKFGRKEGAIRQRLERMRLIKYPYDPEYAALMINKNS